MGSMLPLIFKRFGLDPALMSNQFVAGLSDLLGILIYVHIAMLFLV
jgi:magnesium transporter